MPTKSSVNKTKDKLMTQAIELMAEKGYKGVSTKEIAAAAGLSEMTLFRNFGSKMKLLESAIDRYHYSVEMSKIFEENIQWDLKADLVMIGRMYHEMMDRNRKLFLIVLRDEELKDIRENAQKHPLTLLELLKNYFQEMQHKGKMIPTDAEAQAIHFMWMNYGAFMSRLLGGPSMSRFSISAFIESSTDLFVRGLKP
ncbi:TetR/AcrR family transcriptional regulator [Paenibacillus sp. alder61]|nr:MULTISPECIES: TetR/AcrR family transcriptional regulator [Paenibacillus]MCA1291969.1 TetR/AcrR family transcriptional regulator [Paenibacillus sp. alder61]